MMLSLTEFNTTVFAGIPMGANILADYAKYCEISQIPFSITDEELDTVVINHYKALIKEVF